MEPIIIARLATSRAVCGLILGTIVWAVLGWYLLTTDFGDNEARKWMVLLFVPIMLFWFAQAFLQLFLHGNKVLWITDGKLISKQGYPSTAALGDIKDAVIGDSYVGTPGWRPRYEKAILVKLRGGGEMTIDIRYLSEPAPVVLARLRDALGLPRTV